MTPVLRFFVGRGGGLSSSSEPCLLLPRAFAELGPARDLLPDDEPMVGAGDA
jgi:hypothetical protein